MSRVPITLNISDFIRTGEFGFLRLGESKEEIQNQLFPPEDWGPKGCQESLIWRYGNFELHFADRTHLSGIFCDYIPDMDGGESIIIEDWWILRPGSNVNLLRAIAELNSIKLNFHKISLPHGLVELRLESGVYMAFENPKWLHTDASHHDQDNVQDANDFPMAALGKR